MAEDNYLAAVNAARQRTRTDVRRRIDQIIDPMESAANMDRMQGANVMRTTGQVDPGVSGVFQLAGGGGGSAPIRTAVGGGDAPVQATGIFSRQRGGQTTVQRGNTGNCRKVNGKWVCGDSAPPATVQQAEAPTQQSAPAQTSTVPAPSRPATYQDIWTTSDGLFGNAIGMRHTDPATAATTERYGMVVDSRAPLLIEADQRDKDRVLATQIATDRGISEKDKAQALLLQAQGEKALSGQQAQMTKEHTADGYSDTAMKKLAEVTDHSLNPEIAVDSIMMMHNQPLPADEKRKQPGAQATPLTSDQYTEKYKSTRRMVYGTLFISNAIKDSKALRQHANVMDGADISGDGEDGAPEDIVMKDALEKLAAGYMRAGVFDQPYEELQLVLENDVGTVLRRELPELWLAERQDEFAAMQPQERTEAEKVAREQAKEYATAMTDYVNLRVTDMWARKQRGDFDIKSPWKATEYRAFGSPPPDTRPMPQTRQSPATIDSNNTLPDTPLDGLDYQTPSRSRAMLASARGKNT